MLSSPPATTFCRSALQYAGRPTGELLQVEVSCGLSRSRIVCDDGDCSRCRRAGSRRRGRTGAVIKEHVKREAVYSTADCVGRARSSGQVVVRDDYAVERFAVL